MKPHEQRVVDERSALADKEEKLGAFLYGIVFNSLPQEERMRLVRQRTYMALYLNVLDERIAAFPKE